MCSVRFQQRLRGTQTGAPAASTSGTMATRAVEVVRRACCSGRITNVEGLTTSSAPSTGSIWMGETGMARPACLPSRASRGVRLSEVATATTPRARSSGVTAVFRLRGFSLLTSTERGKVANRRLA